MNTHDKIELPPLVGTLANMPEHHKAVIESYGRACALVAVKADRQRRGEPVAWIRKNGFRFIAEIEPQDDSEVPLYAAPVAAQVPQHITSATAARDEFPMLYDSLDALDERAAEQPERIGTQRHLSSLRTSIQAVVQKLSLARARISDLESAASAEPVLYQFLGGNGTWGNVINDQHLFDLIATGYTIRALYAAPEQPTLVSQAYRGWKDKYCTKVEFK